jgi:hypothetical protein
LKAVLNANTGDVTVILKDKSVFNVLSEFLKPYPKIYNMIDSNKDINMSSYKNIFVKQLFTYVYCGDLISCYQEKGDESLPEFIVNMITLCVKFDLTDYKDELLNEFRMCAPDKSYETFKIGHYMDSLELSELVADELIEILYSNLTTHIINGTKGVFNFHYDTIVDVFICNKLKVPQYLEDLKIISDYFSQYYTKMTKC